ncbi:MAG: nickel pincer cofactor biosynthesis protein LarB [Clostridiales Family XIII bacterium]|jgi:NCAIR mutase (PurE)-related protein|nr:nickel pincer cofactor biosynthesis protein LarB [Clostridiales Family XIII bacterium]
MNRTELGCILRQVADGEISPAEASERIRLFPYDDMDFAKIDLNRELRTGRPEVIFCLGKTPDQTASIMKRMAESADLIIATKAGQAHFDAARAALDEDFSAVGDLTLAYHAVARVITLRRPPQDGAPDAGDGAGRGTRERADAGYAGSVAVVTAGTADIPIAEEAALAAELYGQKALRVFDVGVAGLHRLLDRIDTIRRADAVVVVAGMEGALASVVGGLVDRPVIAVPTSVGYGASMGGLTALFSMLNSCSLGVCVMNIDNGFGAGYLASVIAER